LLLGWHLDVFTALQLLLLLAGQCVCDTGGVSAVPGAAMV
jgi:hypothetical protein